MTASMSNCKQPPSGAELQASPTASGGGGQQSPATTCAVMPLTS